MPLPPATPLSCNNAALGYISKTKYLLVLGAVINDLLSPVLARKVASSLVR
jgi:hypothetical protein